MFAGARYVTWTAGICVCASLLLTSCFLEGEGCYPRTEVPVQVAGRGVDGLGVSVCLGDVCGERQELSEGDCERGDVECHWYFTIGSASASLSLDPRGEGRLVVIVPPAGDPRLPYLSMHVTDADRGVVDYVLWQPADIREDGDCVFVGRYVEVD